MNRQTRNISSTPTGGGSGMAQEGQAKAADPGTVTFETILVFIGTELATSLVSLEKRFNLTEDQVKSKLETLTAGGLVQAQGPVDSPSTVYSLTQHGAETVERTVKRGLSAYI